MLVLDLFCGEGGAAAGYRNIGFDVFGVDNDARPLKRYPFKCMQFDALDLLEAIAEYGDLAVLGDICGPVDLIHASPPCQGYSRLLQLNQDKRYPRLIEPLRELLIEIGIPYVIENVDKAPLIDPVLLCGSMFGLTTEMEPFGTVALRRHRLFECSFQVVAFDCDHQYPSVPVYGHGPSGPRVGKVKGPGLAKAQREVMEIDWMTRDGICQAIPPVYAEFIGAWAMVHLRKNDLAEAA